MDKRIITAAITGSIHTPTMSPFLPITPDEIVEETIRAFNAGAAVAHIHARDPQTGAPSADINLIKEIVSKIKSRCNIIICITTGGGVAKPGVWMNVEQRVRAIEVLKPEMGSLNFGSINFALFHTLDKYKEFKFEWEYEYLKMTEDLILPNTFKTLNEFSRVFQSANTRPEIEIYDVGMLNNLSFMLERGQIQRPIYIQFILGILGGIPASVANLQFLFQTAKDLFGKFAWSVCAAGRNQFSMCTLGMIMGGNVRVGLEDNLYVGKGMMAKSNAEQVEKIAGIARDLGLEPATADEARAILNLKGLNQVAF